MEAFSYESSAILRQAVCWLHRQPADICGLNELVELAAKVDYPPSDGDKPAAVFEERSQASFGAEGKRLDNVQKEASPEGLKITAEGLDLELKVVHEGEA